MEGNCRTDRLGIFIFYDASGIADEYVQVLLRGIRPELDKLVIVVNGTITDASKHKLEKYADKIFVRKNIGFDAGGYKDALISYLSGEEWNQWDEVVLFNDTFYGPIHPWKQIFQQMKDEEVDFWGLSRYVKDGDYPDHIQSYFLVCRKKMVLHPAFWHFWNTLDYPGDRSDATRNYEIRFTTYFGDKGFCWKAYTDVSKEKINMSHGGSPYMYYAYELLSKSRFPIIKRNALSITNFIRARQALDYVENHTDYKIDLICRHLERLAKENRIKSFNPLQLKLFYQTHDRIFIYGHGEYGKNVAAYFEYQGWSYDGFVVSVKSEPNIEVFAFSEVKFSKDDGIILALGRKAYEEVVSVVREKLTADQLFTPGI